MRAERDDLDSLLRVAQELALQAGAVTMEHFGRLTAAEVKGDGTPVTPADRASETLMRSEIERRFPGHGVLGEEYGQSHPEASIQWILDPIDGTRTFLRGVPLFGVLIGVLVDGTPSVGVAHIPALGETVAAALGLGCWWNGKPCKVSAIGDIPRAAVLATEPADLLDGAIGRGWEKLVRSASLVRTWGDCYGHILVATGRADVMIDPVLAPWDAAPFPPIMQEAGGSFTDLGGRPVVDGGSGLSTNGLLHGAVLSILSEG